MTETKNAPGREAFLWLQTTFRVLPIVFGSAARVIMAGTRIALRVGAQLLRQYAPVLRNRNAVAMWIAQGAMAFGLPIAAEHLDAWTLRLAIAAQVASALLFIGDSSGPGGPPQGGAVGLVAPPARPAPGGRTFD